MKLNVFKIPKDRLTDLKDKFKTPSLGLKVIKSKKLEIIKPTSIFLKMLKT